MRINNDSARENYCLKTDGAYDNDNAIQPTMTFFFKAPLIILEQSSKMNNAKHSFSYNERYVLVTDNGDAAALYEVSVIIPNSDVLTNIFNKEEASHEDKS